MKKITIFVMLLMISSSLISQQTYTSSALIEKDFLHKSKSQKKIGWIMFGGGAACMLTSFIIPQGESKGFTGSWGGFSTEEFKNDGIKGAFGLSGTISMLCSIPVFIAAGKNKRKAMSLAFKKETATLIQKNSFVYRSVPSLSLKISL